MKLLVSLLSNKPEQVEQFLLINSGVFQSSRHQVDLLINWNGLEEYPPANVSDYYYDSFDKVTHTRTCDVYDKDGVPHWNEARLSTVLERDFDYVWILDDDVRPLYHVDRLLDLIESHPNNIGHLMLRGKEAKPKSFADNTELIEKYNIGLEELSIQKVNRYSDRVGGNQCGQILSREYFLNNYEEIMKYNNHGEDCWRTLIALMQDNCYVSSTYVGLCEYNPKQYPRDLRTRAALEVSKISPVPIFVSQASNWRPIYPSKLAKNYEEVLPNIYVLSKEYPPLGIKEILNK